MARALVQHNKESGQMRTRLVLAVWVIFLGSAAAQPQRHDSVVVVPVPGSVSVDGELTDWDFGGSIECAFDESLRPRLTARVAFL